jgi:hypothetical protein
MSKKKVKVSTKTPNPSVLFVSMNLTNLDSNFNYPTEQSLLNFFQKYGFYILPILILIIASFLYYDILYDKNVFHFKDMGRNSYNFDYPKLYHLAINWEKLYLYTLLIIVYFTLRFAKNQHWNFGQWFKGLETVGLISVLGLGIGGFMLEVICSK